MLGKIGEYLTEPRKSPIRERNLAPEGHPINNMVPAEEPRWKSLALDIGHRVAHLTRDALLLSPKKQRGTIEGIFSKV